MGYTSSLVIANRFNGVLHMILSKEQIWVLEQREYLTVKVMAILDMAGYRDKDEQAFLTGKSPNTINQYTTRARRLADMARRQ